MAESMTEWESKTVDELKQELKSRGLSVSGKKSELVSRLDSENISSGVLEAEIVSGSRGGGERGIIEAMKSIGNLRKSEFPISTLIVAGIIIVGATGGALLFGDDLVECCLLYTSPSPRDATLSGIAGWG